MTSDSAGEQASAGLDALSRAVITELSTLNARYRRAFASRPNWRRN